MQYSTYKNTIQQLAQKIGDVEQERDEHMCVFISCILTATYESHLRRALCSLRRQELTRFSRAVLETLEPLSGDRKCFRMINGVLVEMKVKDALPPLKTNTEGLKVVEKDLKDQLLAKQKELDAWKVSHIRTIWSFVAPFVLNMPSY